MDQDQDELIKLYFMEVQKFCALVRKNMPEKKKKTNRSCAVRKLLKERRTKGFYMTLIPSMRLNDVESFINFHRMEPKTFDELLSLLGPNLKELPTRYNEEITPSERLSLTLKYLASGDSMKSIGFHGFRVGASTTSCIIRDTCYLIWEKLQFVFPTPSDEMWQNIAEEFHLKWGYPNCLGAIDGKYVVYLHKHNLPLIAVVDANFKFIMVDIDEDAEIYETSKLVHNIMYNPDELKIPKHKTLPNSNINAPFVFLTNETFPLSTNIMQPYPWCNNPILPLIEDNFNQRLSQARRVVDDAFSIMASRFRIYRKSIIACKETTRNIVKATVCLHNWLWEKNSAEIENTFALEAAATEPNLDDAVGLKSFVPTLSNYSQNAVDIRNKFAEYFLQQNY